MDYPAIVTNVLKKLNIKNPILLGKGGEGYVFDYSGDQVIKIYTNPNVDENMVKAVREIQKSLVASSLPFALSEIIEIISNENALYTFEKKLTGQQMDKVLAKATVFEKQKMLENYYLAAKALGKVKFNELLFGNFLKTPYSKNAETWQEYLLKVVNFRTELDKDNLEKKISDIDSKIQKFKNYIQENMFFDQKCFVHGDYFHENVFFNNNFEVSAVLDIGIHAVVGDPKQDLSGLAFLAPKENFKEEDLNYYISLVEKDIPDIRKFINFYKLYYAFYYSQASTLQDEVIQTLNDEQLWSRL